ncbi:MAG: rRNA maturation RNase YbeY [Holosporaceae bacterium]|jgi:probable rRNA maturation factor|nr:rRNA maturation RNase YbeY [Holosporaceae bacterium]
MNLDISVECDLWNEVDVKAVAEDSVNAAFSVIESTRLNGNRFQKNALEICFLFTNDEEIRLLNKTYRGINKPTNVLSFPTNSALPEVYDHHSEEENMPTCILGSVALAYETVKRESLNQEKSMENHLKHLLVHSLLHLFGHDHAAAADAEEMELLEIAILEKMNVSNPYQ